MTTVNQDYPGPTRPRPGNSPHTSAVQDARSHSLSQAAVTDAWTEAFARLQQQVQYNTTAVEDQRRHLAEFNEVVRTLHAEIGSLWRRVDAIKDDRRPAPSGVKLDEGDIDLLTSELQHVAHKASEVDGIKLQLELMTRRLRRLEGHPSPATALAPVGDAPYHNQTTPSHHYPQQPHHPAHGKPVEEQRSLGPAGERALVSAPVHPSDPRIAEQAQTVPPFRSLDGPNGVGSWRAANHGAASPQGANSALRQDAPAAPGWNAVNNSQQPKRPASVDGSSHHGGSAPGSPKRQKLATLAPRSGYPEQHPVNGHGTAHHTYEATHPAPRSSGETAHQPSNSTSSIRFVPFARETNGHHEVWRHGRKSGGEEEAVKPEVGYRDWSSEGYRNDPQHAYQLSATASDPYRRPYSPESQQRAPSGDTPSPALAEGKKSRTKPTRNADGILIRKDGRPDMRSISSAMNLRKVHAKKEAERGASAGEDGHTPTPSGETGDDARSPHSAGTTPEERRPAAADVVMTDTAEPARSEAPAAAPPAAVV